MEISELLGRARRRVGFSQSLLARLSGVAQPKLSAYEAGREVPSGRTLAKILAAAGATLELAAQRLTDTEMSESASRSLGLHRVVAAQLLTGSDSQRQEILRSARAALDLARSANPHGSLWHDQWAELLEGPLDLMVTVLVGENEHAIELRATSPFAGALESDVRDQVLNRAT